MNALHYRILLVSAGWAIGFVQDIAVAFGMPMSLTWVFMPFLIIGAAGCSRLGEEGGAK